MPHVTFTAAGLSPNLRTIKIPIEPTQTVLQHFRGSPALVLVPMSTVCYTPMYIVQCDRRLTSCSFREWQLGAPRPLRGHHPRCISRHDIHVSDSIVDSIWLSSRGAASLCHTHGANGDKARSACQWRRKGVPPLSRALGGCLGCEQIPVSLLFIPEAGLTL